jgi:uncharacterized repeat protein (TIGR01451 family)
LSNFFSDAVNVLLGNGAGGFGSQADFDVGNNPLSVATGDFNGDGAVDVVAANSAAAPTVSVLLNECLSFDADLLVSLGVDQTTVKQGTTLTYFITVRNFGPLEAVNVINNFTLSSGTTFMSAVATKGHFTTPPSGQTGTVTWFVGDMDPEDQEDARIAVTVIVRGRTEITSTATISSDSFELNPANNTASITLTVMPGSGGKKK